MRWWCVGIIAGSLALGACGDDSSHGSSGGAGGTAGSGGGAGGGGMVPSGTWVRQLSSEGDGSAFALATDGDDNVLALVADDPQRFPHGTPALVKLDRGGAMVWSTPISDYFPLKLAARSNGDVVVAGILAQTDDSGQPADDVVVAGYDPNGSRRFQVSLGSNVAEYLLALSADPRGHVFVVWRSESPVDARSLSELDEDGKLLSTVSIAGTEPFFSTEVDREGNVLALVGTGDYAVRKYDATGSLRWESPVDIVPGGLSADTDGNVLAVGAFAATQNLVTKLGDDGHALFESAFGDTNELASLVASDALGRTFTASTVQDFTDPALTVHVIARLFDEAGALLHEYTVVSSPLEWPVAVTTDSKGALLVAGMTDGTLPGEAHEGRTDAFIARLVP